MRTLALMGVVLVLGGVATAADLKAGWAVQYHQDTFTEEVRPRAVVNENGDDFDRSTLSLVCGGQSVFFAYSPGGLSFEQDMTVQFKGPDGSLTVEFVGADVPLFGQIRVASESDTAALAEIFNLGDDVPFRTETADGTFPAIGFGEVQAISKAACP